MLQSYLNESLLPVTDEGDFKKLKKAADELAKKMVKNKVKISSFTLSMLDPDVAPDSADILEAKDIIVKNWNTFAVNAKDTPLTFIRAVILDALNNISTNLDNALIIWFTSRNVFRYMKLGTAECQIFQKFLFKLANEINDVAIADWGLKQLDFKASSEFTLDEISEYKINKADLQKLLEDASGPTNSSNKSNFDSPNEYFPDEGSVWSYEFAPKAAAAIKKVIDSSLDGVVKVVNENIAEIERAVNGAATEFQRDLVLQNKTLNFRSELLWWKESGYSTNLDLGYSDVNHTVLGIVMAKDYVDMLPVICPKSVDHFFKSTLKVNIVNSDEEISIQEFLEELSGQECILKTLFPKVTIDADKMSLLDFLIALIYDRCTVAEFESKSGIPISTQLSRLNLNQWLYHDIQLQKILN